MLTFRTVRQASLFDLKWSICHVIRRSLRKIDYTGNFYKPVIGLISGTRWKDLCFRYCVRPCQRSHQYQSFSQSNPGGRAWSNPPVATWKRELCIPGHHIRVSCKLSIEGNGLCTSVHCKPTDSHSYLLYSSSHSSHVKNSIPYSQLFRLRRLCSEDFDFSLKSEEMCHFFDKSGYPASVVQAGHHRAQQIDRQSALQTSKKENNNRIPFTLTFHPHNHAVKSIMLKRL